MAAAVESRGWELEDNYHEHPLDSADVDIARDELDRQSVKPALFLLLLIAIATHLAGKWLEPTEDRPAGRARTADPSTSRKLHREHVAMRHRSNDWRYDGACDERGPDAVRPLHADGSERYDHQMTGLWSFQFT